VSDDDDAVSSGDEGPAKQYYSIYYVERRLGPKAPEKFMVLYSRKGRLNVIEASGVLKNMIAHLSAKQYKSRFQKTEEMYTEDPDFDVLIIALSKGGQGEVSLQNRSTSQRTVPAIIRQVFTSKIKSGVYPEVHGVRVGIQAKNL
jgi:hypothetical protein